MKNKFFISFLLIISLLFVFYGCGGKEIDVEDYDDDIILHTKWPFPVGVAVPGKNTSNTTNDDALSTSNPQHKFLKHFNVVVAENEMKPANILPSNLPEKQPSSWQHTDNFFKWANADALVNYAQSNGKRVRGHTLIWHSQTPDWFFKGNGVSGRATKSELYARMENYIRVVFQKYGNKIDTWDVCNEVVSHNVKGAREDSEYTKIMRDTNTNDYEYVVNAFKWARQYADENNGADVKLYLTDFGVERPFNRGGSTKQDDFLACVRYLITNNAPIDGVGFQGHFRLYDHPVEQISKGIDMFSNVNNKKLMIQICELDISLFSNEKNEANGTTINNNNLPTRLSDLADTYRTYFDMFETKYKEGKLNMVLIWGIADGHSWLNDHPVKGRTDHPLLFNRKYRAKEAYIKLVEDRP